jgi:hypothetical protein
MSRIARIERPRLACVGGDIMAAKANAATAEPERDEAEEETTQPRRKLPLKLIIIAAAAFLVVAGGGTAAYFMFMGKKEKAEEAKAAPAVKIAFIDLPDVIVNLTNPGSDRTQFLKAKRRQSCRASSMPFRLTCASCGQPISKAPPACTG